MPIDTSKLILVSGPTKAGKSEWSEKLISDQPHITYIATGPVSGDDDWQNRIQLHRNRRPDNWDLIECPKDLSKSISLVEQSHSILIDSLGGFVSCYLDSSYCLWKDHKLELISTLKASKQLIIIVIEETGWGLVAPTKIGNTFRDRLGELSRELQSISSESWLVVQGRAIDLNQISVSI
ncbi:bifunctional adenosylcobinamide kinase/adenosylcobinamide-phosphate guanylyltransferase [Prochlorococcus sp. MIT 1223]|uniref:bifunctional adenosylcobinamide kinase/adenosylcobinamide-phosphate guanylyltransferase n=1 Tax=Prochlorococcus sp. MIT 1223 TaxID=3096217 RepID=UPI002A74D7DB|nr:bifunctional adenosylcobinamide kinase/adenosylcobinamide-phosphate guanylyltransferase [Prochlorococcus sp. MIT 1223]